MARVRINAGVVRYHDGKTPNRLAFSGDVVEVSEEERARLIKVGAILPETVEEPVVVEAEDEDEDDESESEDEAKETPVPAVRRPGGTAPHAKWVAYAVAKGMPEAEAKEMTRAQIAEAFPEDD